MHALLIVPCSALAFDQCDVSVFTLMDKMATDITAPAQRQPVPSGLFINRPGVARAVLQTPLSLIN